MAYRPLNITSILNNFKSLIKQVCEKRCTHKFNKKKGWKYRLDSRLKTKVGKNTYTEREKQIHS